ncbi:MAG: 23S rRNA (uracil(1939)-C(5))-methyltransferase RlmD [Clostridiales bacterium]|nr:23S rRNA (uracil(1939)-C(5))-methyltransferase RlmD [Candidatus Crickella caballi]
MNVNDIIEVKIEDLINDGRGFARCDGLAVFIAGGVPGDTATVRVSKVKKNIAEAELVEIVEPSPDRMEAVCPYFGSCGGCSLQEMDYDAQLKLKETQIRSKLTRLGGIEEPTVREIIGANTLEGYRNKATFAVGPHGEVGFLKNRSHYVIDVEDCMLQSEPAMACAAALREFLHGKAGCIKQMIVKTAFTTGEIMVVLESDRKEIPGIERLAELLDEQVYNVGYDYTDESGDHFSTDMTYSLESLNVICNGKCRTVAGKPTIIEKITSADGKDLQFEISPQSFYQVNPEQMVKLYSKAIEYAGLTGDETLLDLYCGVGTIGIFAADKAKSVIGIESVKPAVLDANRNSVINGIINTRYICGKAEEELPGMMGIGKLYKYNEVNEIVEREPEIRLSKADVAIVDPPRAGCDEALLNAVVTAEPKRIVYVSCDPGTLARDIKYLESNGYRFEEATPVDMFPWTNHVETVVLLSRA